MFIVANYYRNAHWNYKVSFHTTQWPLSQKVYKEQMLGGCAEKGTSCSVGGNVNRCSHHRGQRGGSFKNRAPIRFRDPIPGKVSRENCNSKTHATQCSQKHYLPQPRQRSNLMSKNRQTDKARVHTHNGILLSHKKKEIMQHGWTQRLLY